MDTDHDTDVICTIYVYRLRNGTTQVRTVDTDDFEFARDCLEEGLKALDDGEPVIVS